MGNEDRKLLMENVSSIPRDFEKQIEIHGGAGELGANVFKVKQWKNKCKQYFDRHFKTSAIILVPSDGDIVMNTLSSVCSANKSRGFVFKNYNIAKHFEFLGYDKEALNRKLRASLTNKSISYIAFIEQKNVIYICEKLPNVSNMDQCLKNIAHMVTYFLILYHKEIQASGVTVIGVLIRGNEKQEFVECKFCHLFSPSFKDFESKISFENWWIPVENYEGWWHLANPGKPLFDDLAAKILCFMAAQEKVLPHLTGDKSQQFKQTYFLYTPQQMNIHFSDAKHVVIQGSYGSGKSLLGLKKLELIWNSLGRNQKIIYVNFDSKSKLYFLMKQNVKEYVKITSRKIKLMDKIRDIVESPGPLVCVYHNKRGENLSSILQETVKLNKNLSEEAKTNYHFIIEEYDGETLTQNEAARITKLVKGNDLMESNIVLLAQPLMKNRSWNIGKESYEKETCVFRKLANTFRIVKLDEVLRCSNKIFGVTKYTQSFVRNRDSIFETEMDEVTFKQQQQPNDSQKHMVSHSSRSSNQPGVATSRNERSSYPSEDSAKTDKSLDLGMDLDQAFQRSAPDKKSIAPKSKIVSKFDFLCEPREGVDIEGLKPNLVEFSEDIDLISDIAVISLVLVLKRYIGNNKTTFLYMADEQPKIVRHTLQLLIKLDETFSYTEDMERYLQEKEKSKMIFASNFRSVNGMEFDHVVIFVSQSEYFLQHYLPQAISRCTLDLTLVLLPKENGNAKEGLLQKLSRLFPSTRSEKNKETVANMIEELKRESLVKQLVVAECKTCEKNSYDVFYNETDDMERLEVHTHSDQHKKHLESYAKLVEQQPPDSSAGPHTDARCVA